MGPGDNTLLLAFGLGLLGFVEPCTIGAHMIFLEAQRSRPLSKRLSAAIVFLLARLVVMAGFGGLIAVIGQKLIGVQTGFWLAFGVMYLFLGAALLLGRNPMAGSWPRLSPAHWKAASNPVVQGAAFGLNIPACAAPILFAVIGATATVESMATGALMMAVFAMALSAPLIPLSVAPGLAQPLQRLGDWLRPRRRLLGLIFLVLGLWSIWFGLYVDPVDWSGQ